jgi:hypothetical protein
MIAVMIRAALIFTGEMFAADTRQCKGFSVIGSLQRVMEFNKSVLIFKMDKGRVVWLCLFCYRVPNGEVNENVFGRVGEGLRSTPTKCGDKSTASADDLR